jgi:DNA polymerase-3 subunit epsilon
MTLPAHWNRTPIHAIDFEGSLAGGVVEYGVATLLEGKIAAAHTRICRGKGPIRPQESAVHGLTEADTAAAAPFAQERELFFSLRESGPLAAHNAAFENRLLADAWPVPRPSPNLLSGRTEPSWGPWIDTLRLHEAIYPGLPDRGLSALVAAFALEKELDRTAATFCPQGRRRYHCALYDAIACALLLTRLGTLPGYEGLSTPWLLARSGARDSAQGELFR